MGFLLRCTRNGVRARGGTRRRVHTHRSRKEEEERREEGGGGTYRWNDWYTGANYAGARFRHSCSSPFRSAMKRDIIITIDTD